MAVKGNALIGPPGGIAPTTHCMVSTCSTTELCLTPSMENFAKNKALYYNNN